MKLERNKFPGNLEVSKTEPLTQSLLVVKATGHQTACTHKNTIEQTDRPWSAGEFLSTKKNFMIRQVKRKYKHSFAKVCTLHDRSPIPVNVVKGMNKKENSSD